jgi:O-methyltransferase
MGNSQSMYLDLLKKCLTFYLWGESAEIVDSARALPFGINFIFNAFITYLKKHNLQLMKKFEFDPEKRAKGQDWPPLADTMIGLKRLDNLQYCIETVLENNVPGDLIETGVWRGGGSIFMRGVLKAYGSTDRTVWVADSFEGLPPPDVEKYPQDAGDIHHELKYLAVPIETVKANFARYDLLDDNVKFLKGWFKDTLPGAPIDKLALIRLDGDMYESTMDGLVNLYPKLSSGGYIIVDDYCLKGCREAVHDYRGKNGITDEIIDIDGTGAFWRNADY